MKLALLFIAAAVATQTHPHKKKLRDSNQTNVNAATTLKRSQSEAGRWWCPVGQYSVSIFSSGPKASAGCQYCPSGMFQNVNKHFGSSCKACGSGQYQSSRGQGHCNTKRSCGAGTFVNHWGSRDSNRQCVTCEAGKFSSGNNWGACNTCEDGKFAAATGSNKCVEHQQCAEGAYTSSVGTSSQNADCTACSPGTASSAESTTCDVCEAGKYSNEEAQSACKECADGHTSEVGASGCSACDAGQYEDADSCASCGAGQFQANKGATNCSHCPDGTVAPEAGATQCTACANGKHTTDGKTCVANTCACAHGKAASGADCSINGGQICTACDGDRKLYNGECDGCRGGYVLQGGSCVAISTNCCSGWSTTCCGFNQNNEGTRSRQCYLKKWFSDNQCASDVTHFEGTHIDTGTCERGFKC